MQLVLSTVYRKGNYIMTIISTYFISIGNLSIIVRKQLIHRI